MMHISREANLLAALSIAIGDSIREAATCETNLDPSGQAAVVAISSFLEGCTIVELSRLAGLTHSATVRLVDRLVDQGFVRRGQGADRRTIALHPTRRGRDMGQRILAARERTVGALVGGLGSRERRELAPILEDLLSTLVRDQGDPFRICRMCDAAACGHYEGRCPVTETVRELSANPRSGA